MIRPPPLYCTSRSAGKADDRWYAEQDAEVDMTSENMAFLTEVNIRFVVLLPSAHLSQADWVDSALQATTRHGAVCYSVVTSLKLI